MKSTALDKEELELINNIENEDFISLKDENLKSFELQKNMYEQTAKKPLHKLQRKNLTL